MDKKKHVGDVLGISRSTARAPIARSSKTGGRKPKGVEVHPPRPLKPEWWVVYAVAAADTGHCPRRTR
jgi:hypothetical protein